MEQSARMTQRIIADFGNSMKEIETEIARF